MTEEPMTRINTRSRPGQPAAKPKSNVYTVLLIISFCAVVTAIVFTELHLVQDYGMEWSKTLWPFGGG
jgi:hypothetical protein